MSLQLRPEDDGKKLHPQANSQAKIQSQQASSQARDHPHHLQGNTHGGQKLGGECIAREKNNVASEFWSH